MRWLYGIAQRAEEDEFQKHVFLTPSSYCGQNSDNDTLLIKETFYKHFTRIHFDCTRFFLIFWQTREVLLFVKLQHFNY